MHFVKYNSLQFLKLLCFETGVPFLESYKTEEYKPNISDNIQFENSQQAKSFYNYKIQMENFIRPTQPSGSKITCWVYSPLFCNSLWMAPRCQNP